MSRSFANNGRLRGTAPVTGYPCSASVWFKRSALATDVIFHLGAVGSVDGLYIQVNSSGTVSAVKSSGGSAVAATTTTSATDTTTWHLAVATWASATEMDIELDGAGKGTQPLSRTPTGIDTVQFGQRLDGSNSFSGLEAHGAIYDKQLSAAEKLALYTNLPSGVAAANQAAYWPFRDGSSPEVDTVDAIALTVTNATTSSDNPPIGPPVITTVGTIQPSSSLTITGFGFKPAATHPVVVIGGRTQTVNSSTDTTITINSTDINLYGNYPVNVTSSLGLTDSLTVPILPPTGYGYVNLVAPLVSASQRLTSVPDLQAGWQVEYEIPVASGVQVLEDGSFVADTLVTDFGARTNDGTGYGTSADQVRDDPTDPPVLTGLLPDVTVYLNAATQIDVGSGASGWEEISIVGTPPTGLSIPVATTGIITGTPTVAGPVLVTIRYTNAGGSVDAAPFVLTVISAPQVIGVPESKVYTTLSGAPVINIAQYFQDATDYTSSPPLPVSWQFSAGLIRPSTLTPGNFGPYTITATSPAGTASLAPFSVTVNLYEAEVRTQINDHQNVMYFSTYFGTGGPYSIFPAVPPEWRFYSALGRIVYPADEEGDFVFTVTDTSTGRYLELTIEVFSGVLPLRPRTSLREFLL